MKTLKDFLDEQADTLRAEVSEAAKVRDEWVAALARLIAQMEEWLAESDPAQILQIEETSTPIREIGTGQYDAPGLSVTVGRRQVRAVPVSRFVMGPHSSDGRVAVRRAFGRVDLTNGLERYMIFRLEKEPEDRWSIIEQDSYRMERFNRDSFEGAMQSLLG